ncbi:MAG TPA: hypothetical protein VFI35_13965 [Actinomycetota bacterium]|nr:hypothetical protein [Actinomycetota bacterium]
MLVLLVGTLVVSGLVAPASLAQEEGDLVVSIVEGQQPTDAGRNDLITASPFDSTSPADGFVQVEVSKYISVEEELVLVPAEEGEVEVKFRLAEGAGLAEGTLSVSPELTDEGGIATFDTSLSIAETNDFMATDYKIVPQARYASEITLLEEGWPFEGDPSDGFDIWEDGCSGTGCNVNLRSNLETYTAQGNFGLAASQLSGELVTCPTQRVIFSNKTFFHVTTGDESEVVRLETHITRADMKAAANNGQRHIGWCIGLESPDPWEHNGAAYTPQTIGGKTFYVALAPKCPNKKTAPQFAPCIVSQSGDNDGGSFIRGFVLGGDPPRRT